MDKYVKHEASADKRLLTNRWREDPVEAAVDPNHDGNAFSFYFLSRLDIRLAKGEQWDCENLRKGCAGMVTEPNPGSYDISPPTQVPRARIARESPARKALIVGLVDRNKGACCGRGDLV